MRSLIMNARELLARLIDDDDDDDDSSDDETTSVQSLDDNQSGDGANTDAAVTAPSASLREQSEQDVAAPYEPSQPEPLQEPVPQSPSLPPSQQDHLVDLTTSDDARDDLSLDDDVDDEDKDDGDDVIVTGTSNSNSHATAVSTLLIGNSSGSSGQSVGHVQDSTGRRILSVSATGGSSSNAIGSRFMGIIVDDDDDDSDSDDDAAITPGRNSSSYNRHGVDATNDDDDDDAIMVTDATGSVAAPPTTLEPYRFARKRARHEMASTSSSSSSDAVVVVETQVVYKAQPTECTICCDACTIAGTHRLVALKCGHLFGRECIDRWVSMRKACPNCNLPVRKPDIRPLFSDHVAVVDNAGIAEMTDKFEAEKAKRIQLEQELALIERQHQAEIVRQKCEVQRLHDVVRELQSSSSSSSGGVSNSTTSSVALASPTQLPPPAIAPSSATKHKPRWR